MMPEFMRNWLESLTPQERAELGSWIMTSDDNDVTTEIVEMLESVV